VKKNFLVFGVGLFLLTGCALPPAIQITSWALDGISYLATQKSATDHGLSIIAQKDCAMLRVVLGPKELCRDFDDSATELADGMAYKQLFEGNDFIIASSDPLAEFEPAGGGDYTKDPNAGENQLRKIPMQNKLAALDDMEGLGPYGGGPYEISGEIIRPQAGTVQLSQAVENRSEPAVGYYTVIGSFKNHTNARKLSEQHRVLTPSVLSAKLNSTTLYRVVVGPFTKNDEKSVKVNISQAGIHDTWTIQVKPGDWRMAVLDQPIITSVEIASAQSPMNLRNSNKKGFAKIPSKLVY
jgi:hypothetical protein